MRPAEYDRSATGVGIVDAGSVLGADRVRPGDVLIGLASSGLHSNGYSLVRRVLADGGLALQDSPASLGGRTLGEELLEPTRIYARDCLALAADAEAAAFAHITGGGLAANLARVLPAALTATIDRATWTPPPVFSVIAATGDVRLAEMERTFNLGVGMVAVVPAHRRSDALALAAERGVPAWELGLVSERSSPTDAPVVLSGSYAGPAGRWR
jgi:phosphoribosylformylglycinamidine cyclo-ligase